jgi:hypothetical protein
MLVIILFMIAWDFLILQVLELYALRGRCLAGDPGRGLRVG